MSTQRVAMVMCEEHWRWIHKVKSPTRQNHGSASRTVGVISISLICARAKLDMAMTNSTIALMEFPVS
jgi:hypothetical protein